MSLIAKGCKFPFFEGFSGPTSSVSLPWGLRGEQIWNSETGFPLSSSSTDLHHKQQASSLS